jgi:hypothetical protein
MIRRVGTIAVLCIISAPAFAQGDPMAMAHTAAANQLGIVEYCQSQGSVGADAVDAQKTAMAQLPPSTVSTADAEALGKQGTLSMPNGTKATLASLATAHNTTVAAMCDQIGKTLIQAVAMSKQGTMGGMQMPTAPH